MEILEYIMVALVMGVISYIIVIRKDKRTIKRGDEWD
jgi:preprotein translocase subunit YajC